MAPRKRKSLGQHFLRDERIVKRILQAAELSPGQRVLEVGPGAGVLTRPLLDAVGPAGQVVAFELDPRFAASLEAEAHPNLHIRHGDVMRADLALPVSAQETPAGGSAMQEPIRYDRIVSNLPFQISGPVTIRFLELLRERHTAWDLAVLMYQKEFADRLLASPGSKAYSRLTVHVARYCTLEPVTEVSPACFDPPPRVRSLVVKLTPHAEPPFQVADDAAWQALVNGTFSLRRKKLRNSVPPAMVGIGIDREASLAVVERIGWGDRRPEELAPAEFARLVGDLVAARDGTTPGDKGPGQTEPA